MSGRYIMSLGRWQQEIYAYSNTWVQDELSFYSRKLIIARMKKSIIIYSQALNKKSMDSILSETA